MTNSEFNIEIKDGVKSFVLTFENEYTITGSWGSSLDCASKESEDYSDGDMMLFSIPNIQVTVNDPNGDVIPFTKKEKHKGFVSPEQFVSIAYNVSTLGAKDIDDE